jgi:hypothetical protein
MNISVAHATITGISTMCQSHKHESPRLDGEQPDDYDKRTWRARLNINAYDAVLNSDRLNAKFVHPDGSPLKASVVLPAHGLHMAIAAGARYSARKIPGRGSSTWTKKFEAGIMLMDDPVVMWRDPDWKGDPDKAPVIGIDPNALAYSTMNAHANGKRGSSSRVTRRIPFIPPGWVSTFEVCIIDPIINETIFFEMLGLTGLYVGLGQGRPENGGGRGRFSVLNLEWTDNREFLNAA